MLLLTVQLAVGMDFLWGVRRRKRVNARSAMQMTAVYSCVRILFGGSGEPAIAVLQV